MGKQRKRHWPGWQRDLELVSLFGPKLVAALGGAVDAAGLGKAWLANNNQTDAWTWLEQQGVRGQLQRALLPVLQEIWANAWELGVSSARQAAAYQGSASQQAYQQMLNRYASQWLNQIVNTILKGIAAILTAGAAGMAAAIIALLDGAASAAMVVQTEITRAMAAGAAEIYRNAGVQLVEWVTAEDDHVCVLCDANEADGPHFLGQPFPSGAIEPPQHPRCRCALLPFRSNS